MPIATRFGVPNRFPSTGMACLLGFSNSTAGPPAFNRRSQISVISRCGSTSTPTRFSSPCFSSCARKSRRSLYFMCWGVPELNLGGCFHQVIKRDSGEYRCAHPVVVEEGLETACPVAIVDQLVLIHDQRERGGKVGIVNDAEILDQSDERHGAEKAGV